MITYYTADYSDEKLLEMMAVDDRKSFDELYNRHWKWLFTSPYHTLKVSKDSLDICQALFLWLWKHRKALIIQNNLQSYSLWTLAKFGIAMWAAKQVGRFIYDDLI